APHLGVNALYAAQIALGAINAVRETFRDEDTIRVHPILTHRGSQVNVIPGEARVETYVRGRTLDGIRDANAKVDRALRAGALALGATVEIETLPGYLPLRSDPTLMRVFKDNADTLFGAGVCRETGHRAGSTDMGDLSQVIPVLHPYMGGARGTGHGADYEVVDPHLAYVMPARALAAMVVDLLWAVTGTTVKVAGSIRCGGGEAPKTNGSRKVPVNGTVPPPPASTIFPTTVPSGTLTRTAGEKSILPLNLPLAITNSGLSTRLSPWTTTVKVPPNLPRPVTRLMLSDPVALMVQGGAPTGIGQSGVPAFAVPISSEVAL